MKETKIDSFLLIKIMLQIDFRFIKCQTAAPWSLHDSMLYDYRQKVIKLRRGNKCKWSK